MTEDTVWKILLLSMAALIMSAAVCFATMAYRGFPPTTCECTK